MITCLLLVSPVVATGLDPATTAPSTTEPLTPASLLDFESGQGGDASGNQPVWYTDEIHEKAVQAGQDGLAYNWVLYETVALTPGLKPIRPGMPMVAPQFCTLGFAFGTQGAYQLSSAGHCFYSLNRTTGEYDSLPNDEAVMLLPSRDGGTGGLLLGIGDLGPNSVDDDADDWALINIYDAQQAHVSPMVLGFGGPVDKWDSWTGILQPVAHIGRPALVIQEQCNRPELEDVCEPEDLELVESVAFGAFVIPRTGVLVGIYTTSSGYGFKCICEIEGGDSGSPVVVYPFGDTPHALGLITEDKDVPHVGQGLEGTRRAIGTMVDRIEQGGQTTLAPGFAVGELVPEPCDTAPCGIPDPPDPSEILDELHLLW